jgi:hypothetical protein
LSNGEFRKERTKYLMIIKYRAKANPRVPKSNPRGNSRLLSVVEATAKKGESLI